ncbi:MAG: inositol monophosphatase [Syntrophobacteraceae bacterium]|nr:inositol monophosphatase [Syntrophobacteraceae bacterium]
MIEGLQETAKRAILEAGALIRQEIGTISSSRVRHKAPFDYVTDVDHRCEDLILKIIHESFPSHGIIAEESPGHDLQDGITWVVDPLDGTVNFIHGFPFVSVSIAVCENRKPFLGLVLDPLRDELFIARAGDGATLNGSPIHVAGPTTLDEALIATGFPHRTRSIIDPYMSMFRAVFPEVSGIRRGGSAALDLAYVAAGRLDGFWEAGLKAWDIAAGSLLITEAGGSVTDFWGGDEYLLSGHVVAGTDSVYSYLLEQVGIHLADALR